MTPPTPKSEPVRRRRFKARRGATANVGPAKANWYRTGFLGVGIIGIGLAVYLSVKSSPSLATVPVLPHSIGQWADRHGRLCNFPAYALVALPCLMCATRRSQRAGVVGGLAVLIAALEIVQLWLPTRVADKWDVFWGVAGVLTSWAAVELVHFVLARPRR